MADPFNYQTFNNVASLTNFMTNIKTVATANGWTCDKDYISTNRELYLHSTGNGSQNLYFSMKSQEARDVSGLYHLMVLGNTGFDNGAAWNAQPGRFTNHRPTDGLAADGVNWPYDWITGVPGYSSSDKVSTSCYWIPAPCQTQWVFANSQAVIFYMYHSSIPLITNGAGYLGMVFGAIDSYKGAAETELNFVNGDCYGPNYVLGRMVDFRRLSHYKYFSFAPEEYRFCNHNFGLLYGGINVITPDVDRHSATFTGDDGASLHARAFYSHHNYSSRLGHVGFNYTQAAGHQEFSSRSTLIKPVVSVFEKTATDEYFRPVGELPYYLAPAHPYNKPGDLADFGGRKFMVFPVIQADNTLGAAIEVNP